MKKITLVTLTVILAATAWGQEKKTNRQKGELIHSTKTTGEVEPRLLWTHVLDGQAEDFSVTNDGGRTLVYLNNGDKIYFNRTGKIFKRQKGKRGRVLKNGVFISYDGEILNSEGAIVNKIPMAPPDMEYPILAPNGEYIAIRSVTEAGAIGDSIYLKMYDVKTGELLWKYEQKISGWGYIDASFCSDEKIAVYTKGKVALYDTKSGEKYWDTSLQVGEKYIENTASLPFMETSGEGDAVIIFNENIYEESQRKWTKRSKIFSLDGRGNIRWSYENPETGQVKISNGGEFVFARFAKRGSLLFDNFSGKIISESKRDDGFWMGFTGDDKYVLSSSVDYRQEEKGIGIYVLTPIRANNSAQRNISFKNYGYKKSKFVGTKLIFVDRSETLYFYDISNLLVENGKE